MSLPEGRLLPRRDKSKSQGPAAPIAAGWVNGGFEVIYARRSGDEPSFAFEEMGAGAASLHPKWRGQAGLQDLDLIPPAGKGGWKASKAKTIQSGVDFAEAWAIPGAPTWWTRSEGAAASIFAFMNADSGAGLPMAEGGEYRVMMLAAAHRCRAEAVLRLTDRNGRTVQELRKPISATAKGGRDPEAYDRVEVAFRVPAGATRLEIDIAKGGGAADGDSFLFATKPKLLLGLEDTPHQPLDAQALAAARQAVNAGWLVEMAWLPFVGAEGRRGDLIIQSGADRIVARDVQTGFAEKAAGEGGPPPSLIVSSLKAALAFNRRHDADGRRAHALRLWLERAEAGQSIPDLEPMQAALDAGVTGDGLPTLVKFPVVETPAASVVLIPSSDAETDRLSLVALRFAACRAAFEVIAVQPAKAGAIAAINSAVEKARANRIVLLPAGWEPVAGWLDELLAVFANFDGVAIAGTKTIEHDGRLASAGSRITPKGRIEPLGRDGNPRDPAHGFVRAADAVSPAMISREAWTAAGGLDAAIGDPSLALADLALRSQQLGGRVLYVPTAEVWRIKGAASETEPSEDASLPFRMRWAPIAASSGWRAAHQTLRVLFVDQEAPTVDMDAGGYAAFQEIRLLQALGATVSFLPKNLAWMDRHTIALQRAGVECLYAPFVPNFEQYLRDYADDYDVIFVLRYKVMQLVQEALGDAPRRAKLVLNLADLHFLREIREAAAGTPGFDEARASETQAAELAAIAAADLTLTYSDVEAAVIESHTFGRSKVARTPWVVETRDRPIAQPGGSPTILFLGGFGHPPNAEAVKAFVRDALPAIHERLPDARLIVVGSKAPPDVLALASPHVEVRGYVPDLDAVFAEANIFVAPLIAGAGLKGKVIEALSRGLPTILSPVAAEGTGLVDGVDCLMADSPADWAAAVQRLHTDNKLWTRIAEASLAASRKQFSFEGGVGRMREALAQVGVYGAPGSAIQYRRTLPDRSNGASAAPAVLPTP